MLKWWIGVGVGFAVCGHLYACQPPGDRPSSTSRVFVLPGTVGVINDQPQYLPPLTIKPTDGAIAAKPVDPISPMRDRLPVGTPAAVPPGANAPPPAAIAQAPAP